VAILKILKTKSTTLSDDLFLCPLQCVAAFEGLKKIQNGGHCHGNQDARNVKFTPNSGSF
jgi:hypothetical protein